MLFKAYNHKEELIKQMEKESSFILKQNRAHYRNELFINTHMTYGAASALVTKTLNKKIIDERAKQNL